MKGLRMNWFVLFRIILWPVLLPLSVAYGLIVSVIGFFKSLRAVRLSSPVISVGNFCVGGSGKTPIVGELVVLLKSSGFHPVVIVKSYKALLTKPSDVLEGSDPQIYGDEAVAFKEAFGDASVFSGPHKYKTAVFAEAELSEIKNKVFIIDDGAQHHQIVKDFKVHVWDLSRSFLDMLPFPFGASREFWFLGETPHVSIFNRGTGKLEDQVLNSLVGGVKLMSEYSVQSIMDAVSGKPLSGSFVLISGLGNFRQLSEGVHSFISNKDCVLTREIQGRDHDQFNWFKAEDGINYVCTSKDVVKLRSKVSKDHLFVVNSEFSKDFKLQFSEAFKSFLLTDKGAK